MSLISTQPLLANLSGADCNKEFFFKVNMEQTIFSLHFTAINRPTALDCPVLPLNLTIQD